MTSTVDSTALRGAAGAAGSAAASAAPALSPLSGLGDFVLIADDERRQAATIAMAEAFEDQTAWPRLGDIDAPIERIELWPGAVLLARGVGTVQTAGRAGAWLLSVDTPHRREAEAVAQGWLQGRRIDMSSASARFVLVLWDGETRELALVTDGFRTYPVVYALPDNNGQTMIAASDLRLLRVAYEWPYVGGKPRALTMNPQAVYHYLNFSFVPNEACIWQQAHKLAPGSTARWQAGKAMPTVKTWWDARYPEDNPDDDTRRAAELRQLILDSVRRYGQAPARNWGTFLSGGTDSSSISGILSGARREQGDEQVSSFSIGFAEPGYDELAYATIASDHFKMRAHQSRVSEVDALAVLPRLIDAYDEPFGNASAIPTHCCANLAVAENMNLLVAGDGGDEIFGGNERYLKDRIFGLYKGAPGLVRKLGGGLAGALGGTDARLANKVKNFVRRAELPNPDRFYTDDSFASEHFDELLDERFRSQLGIDDSLDVQRGLYARCDAPSELHRLMYLDLKMTIAANDVVKVTRATRLAGLGVAFPYLDRHLVDYTGRLPADALLRGTQKRWLFKRAMAGILPEAIVKKKKQGFGLPVSVWMRRPGPFRDFIHDTLMSRTTRQRGLFQSAAVERLLERHQRGAWDHAAELYILTMLELWQREHLDKQHGK